MGLLGKFKASNSIEAKVIDTGYQTFSTPFTKIPQTNLSLPFVWGRYENRGYVPFGDDNFYPQYLNQIYYSSPLHGSIVDFKTNATVGGGYTLKADNLGAKEKVDLYAFTKHLNIDKLVNILTKEIIVHERVYFLLTLHAGDVEKVKRISADKVRTNADKSMYSISDDWYNTAAIRKVKPYTRECKSGEFLLAFEADTLGQDIYPIPAYTSALNFAFLSGELSFLAKNNIQNSIFPSFAMLFPKKPQSSDELEQISNSVKNMKGAENAGKPVAFFAESKDRLPELVTIPTNSNDNLFKEASELVTEQICFAHTIDPILLGVRTTGSLGNGSDIKQAYIIFEKNVIMPLRRRVENIINTLFKLKKIDAEFVITNYQIINETITEVEENEVVSALKSLPDALLNKVLENMTQDEIRALGGLEPLKPTE